MKNLSPIGARAEAIARSIVSPNVQSDRRVTFRLNAPAARKVLLIGRFSDGSVPLVRDTNGIWSVTIGPLEPNVYEYSFCVDGMLIIDPSNREVKPMLKPRISVCTVPGDPPLLHDFQSVPHGTTHFHTYYSRELKIPRSVEVYTPPGYETNDATYPTLYLLPGSGDTERTWNAIGRVPSMLDTLLANERAVPMIIVMLDGEAGSRPTLREQGNVNTEALGKDLMGNLVPFVNDLYRVRKKAADRALFGVSRGGGQSLMIGLMHRDTFGRVGGLSSVIMEQKETVERALARGSKTDLDPKPLWLYCGASERFIAKHNEEFCHLLREHGIRYEYTLSEGSHGWPLWRPQFAQLVQRMFI